mmetsp:Transcript_3976/g.8478  ORF Transcript_3976/g.8478 Transcript_3976/m.8478 type:complete len:338 (+) Transcript_3976:126-1139(+)
MLHCVFRNAYRKQQLRQRGRNNVARRGSNRNGMAPRPMMSCMHRLVWQIDAPFPSVYPSGPQYHWMARSPPAAGAHCRFGRKRSIDSLPLTEPLKLLRSEPLLPLDERVTRLMRREVRVSGLMYSSESASNCCSIPSESGLRSGERHGASRVYLVSKLETSSSGCSPESSGTKGASSLRSRSIFIERPRKKGCALRAGMSDMQLGESAATPSLSRGSLVSSPRQSVFASLVNQWGTLNLVWAILRCSSFWSLCHHGGSPVIISKMRTPSAQMSTACPHSIRRSTSGAMYSVVPTSTALPDEETCVAEAVRPMAARPKSHSLMLPSAQTRTFSGLRSR